MANNIKSYTTDGLAALLKENNQPGFRVKQLLTWLYRDYADSYDVMTNLPASLRAYLAENHPLTIPEIADEQQSEDGTRKYVLRLHDGALVETVGIPSDDGRLTVCCSSQAGCAQGCKFCATGNQGFTRNLLPGEIVDQVNLVHKEFDTRVTNVVLMGQGEPFANFDNTIAALMIINDPSFVGVGARHITVSTCGIIKGIERFTEVEEQFTLAISLHSARQEVRDSIMPGVRSRTLVRLKKALEHYNEVRGRRISLEYTLIEGVNDQKADLNALVDYCRGLLCHVNLIKMNSIGESEFKSASYTALQKWNAKLNEAGIEASIRRSRGSDSAGACGQLANKQK